MADEHINKIVAAYKAFSDGDGFSRGVDLEQMRENEYNLNVTLYGFPEEEAEAIDVVEEWEELRKIEAELADVEKRIEECVEELYRD